MFGESLHRVGKKADGRVRQYRLRPCHQTQWHAYADQILPLLIARDTEVLRAPGTVFERERNALTAKVKEASGHLIAAQYGANAQSQTNRSRIVGYDTAVLGDMELLVSEMEEVVKSAAHRMHCGKQVVLVPRAVCQ